MKNNNKELSDDNDKIECFARISKYKCNALIKKDCKNCNFYKDKKKVVNYKQYLIIDEINNNRSL